MIEPHESAPEALRGKRAIVTGASSGIGAAIAEAVAAAGADVALVGRNAERLARTAHSIASGGRRALPLEADVTDDAARRRVVEETARELGGVDVLINCAGAMELAPFDESLPVLDRQWELNVRAPFALTQHAMPHLRRARGAILFLSSTAAHVGVPNGTAYCAVKGALESLVRALALEEAPNGVRVNAIAPGNVRTPLNSDLLADADYERTKIALTPAGRIGEVEDIAPAAAFLVSDAAGYITGTSLRIDGGWTAR